MQYGGDENFCVFVKIAVTLSVRDECEGKEES